MMNVKHFFPRFRGEEELDPFISTWDTRNTSSNSSDSNQIKLALHSSGNYDFVVDWGDNTTDSISQWDQPEATHTYQTPGIYEIKITGICTGWGFGALGNGNDHLKILDVSSWGNLKFIQTNVVTLGAFRDCKNLNFSTTEAPDLSNLSSLTAFFRGCDNFNSDIGSWDVSHITNFLETFYFATSFNNGNSDSINNWNVGSGINFQSMFSDCPFNRDISNWDTSNATSFQTMFRNNPNFNQDISNWDVSNVTSFIGCFSEAESFNQPIGSWNTESATNMRQMFRQANSFNQNIGNWDVSNVISFEEFCFFNTAFDNAGSDDINNWEVSSVTNFRAMFHSTPFNRNIGNWQTGTATTMQQMFQDASFNKPIGNWNVSNVSTFRAMFRDNTEFNQNIGNWDVSGADNFREMFLRSNFNNGGNDSIKNWNVSSGISFQNMFQLSTFNQPLTNWNFSTNPNHTLSFNSFMFGNTVFNSDLSNWNTIRFSNCTDMFNNCPSFNQNIGNWNVENVSTFFRSFQNCTNFNNGGSDSIKNWNPISCTNFASMFQSCSWFNQPIDWNTPSATSYSSMFFQCARLNSPINIQAPTNHGFSITAMFRSCGEFNSPININIQNANTYHLFLAGANSFTQDLSHLQPLNFSTNTSTFITGNNWSPESNTTNYDNLLLAWSELNLPTGVAINFGTARYSSAAVAAKQKIIDDFNWTITDGGLE